MGSALSEPAGCPWQMASLCGFRGPCHGAADVGMTPALKHKHTHAVLSSVGARQGGWGRSGSGSTCCDIPFSLFKVTHLRAEPPSPKWGPLQIAPRRAADEEGLRPGCRHWRLCGWGSSCGRAGMRGGECGAGPPRASLSIKYLARLLPPPPRFSLFAKDLLILGPNSFSS